MTKKSLTGRPTSDYGPSKTGFVFVTITFPPIERVGRKYLLAWKKKRDTYDKAVLEHSKATGVPVKVYNKKWIDSIERGLLESVCMLKWDIDIDDLTEKEFQRRLTDLMHERANDDIHLTRSTHDYVVFFQGLQIKYDADEDVFGQVATFITDAQTIIETHALQEDMETLGPRKAILKIITDQLEPAQLRNAMRDELRIHKFDSLYTYAKPLEAHMTTLAAVKKFFSISEEGTKRKAREGEGAVRDKFKTRKRRGGKKPFAGRTNAPSAPKPSGPQGGKKQIERGAKAKLVAVQRRRKRRR
ncbi:hypothetical protein SPRG_11164 [Saprolegnia parasitica CBS 223.65]|uniref:Uncharacterized protein n=1 Tax=Saprolegnia parasitica (strain CBS 223.65) TaxID=695850 RepID=A0A067C8W7_SAPPC|nr:hypothetical protein SPRG_11164 [Saprolegnia parasitica CBS 223.65]KDO23232.1 hypothetical protein SPRG_11164 [Saprolegnia parasitica CBS 223.65]|eukprot:XP_012206027.1 hypothetical protein SPRG_11164 [Saprolegnia parasitica CBS 223.65]